MNSSTNHWDTIFINTKENELGWYEDDVGQTLKFIQNISFEKSKRVFLSGAGTSMLVDELLDKKYELVLNDISSEALNKLKNRLNSEKKIEWIHQDISQVLPSSIPKVDIWIDRAVLHFLLEEIEIEGYFNNIYRLVKEGGYVLLAEFSTTGATHCATLPLHRYSIDELSSRMGKSFELLEYEEYTYLNPFGALRPYIYALFKRK